MRSKLAATAAFLFALYWIGLQFVGLGGESNLGAGSYYVAAIYILFAFGMFFNLRGFALICACVSFALFAALTLGVLSLFGTDAFLRTVRCAELRCAYEFWGTTVGAFLCGVFSYAAFRHRTATNSGRLS
jgi:hypothetical protein